MTSEKKKERKSAVPFHRHQKKAAIHYGDTNGKKNETRLMKNCITRSIKEKE